MRIFCGEQLKSLSWLKNVPYLIGLRVMAVNNIPQHTVNCCDLHLPLISTRSGTFRRAQMCVMRNSFALGGVLFRNVLQ